MVSLVSGPDETQVLDVSLEKEFGERQSIGKRWIYLERNTVHRQSVGHTRRQERPKTSVLDDPPKRMGDRSVCHNSLGAVKKVLLPKNLDDKIVPHDRLYKLLGSW